MSFPVRETRGVTIGVFSIPQEHSLTKKGKKIAELKPNNRIVTLSGTSIDLRSPRLVERHGSKDLPDILFEAQTYSTEASYKDTLYVLRHRSQGGLPLDTCSPGQYQHLLKVNYLATFALWR